ncbi:hypothetical protein SAMN05444004_12149 [Jannaschia faecimaris]|uniref:DUF6473 domain-containing protein n=1 Tax=Jannaschia faecimaris TaxID=1244108 RepID=A0A1H3U335_9RHOB|nr:DUF6473 family protein [Jannaschia faecimaris]SDZ55949.1 hypothetical protein SAMN05444004_12149 [Jannaschia faecimaris]
MSYEGYPMGLDYYPCHYGGSRIVFRGPAVKLKRPYTAVIGGSEVYGKYVEDPFTDQLAELTGRRVVNMGVMNAGVDAFALDDALMQVIASAEIVVVQTTGAHNISNRFYTVHPRRNDRFLQASRLLTDLYRDVDFSDFSFTRHMLTTLRMQSPERFARIETELSQAWIARMRTLLSRIPGKRVLLHIEDSTDYGLGPEPPFVNSEMILALQGTFDKFLQCDVSEDCGESQLDGMIFDETERESALRMLSADAHERIAVALARVLRRTNGMAA